MNTILHKITDRIRQTHALQFNRFETPRVIPGRQDALMDVLKLMDNRFFVIAESKKASPSKGVIREPYIPAAIADAYERAGASAVSVITEEHFFMGQKDHLQQVKAVTSLPVLRKDFIIHPYQVFESFRLGADLVLLIVACLTRDELKSLYELTVSLGMLPLVEVHNRQELERALELSPTVIGINNRDLNTFKVDIQTSFRLKSLIPDNIKVISESGIASARDIAALKEAGFAGALIGESLLRQPDPGEALKQITVSSEQ